MKGVLFVLAVVGCGFALFTYNPSFREAVRAKQLGQDGLDRFQNYQTGKALFGSKWPVADGKFVAWGDDPAVGAQPVVGAIWAASGKVEYALLGTRVRHTWFASFDHATHELRAYYVGPEADEALDFVRSGQAKEALLAAEKASQPLSQATPMPGTWKYNSHTALDQRAR